MKATRRWIVVSIATVLLIGAVWYGLHSASPRKVASIPSGPSAIAPHPFTAARQSSTKSKRGALSGDSKEIEDRETVVCGVGAVQLDPKDKAAPFNYVDRL
jgi:hypothetical protein